MPLTPDERTELEEAIMQADLANKKADTAYKEGLLRWEPWKALLAAFGAGLAVASGMIAAIAWVLTHWPHP